MSRYLNLAVLRCSECGAKSVILRQSNKLKKPGHVKHIWCWRCRKEMAHVEEGIEKGRFAFL